MLLNPSLFSQKVHLKAPVAQKQKHIREIHNDTVEDDYYWMIDYFKKGKDSAKVIEYLKEENAYAEKMMEDTKQFQENLFKEMKGRIKEKDESVPAFKNGYFYYTRTEEGKQYYKYCRKKGSLEAPEEVLLDVDKMAEGKAYYSVTGFDVSPDNKLLAYGVDEVSRRQYVIHVKNLETGEVYYDAVPGTSGDPCWAADSRTIFYTSNNPVTLLSEKIKRHTLGTSAKDDAVVYEEKDNTNYIGVDVSKNGKFIFIYSGGTLSSEVRFLEAANPNGEFKIFQPRIKNVLYSVQVSEEHFIIRTNWNAHNFRLMECSFAQTEHTNWKEILPHREEVLVQGVEVFKKFMVVSERKDGLAQFRVRSLTSQEEYYLHFEEATYAASFGNNPEFNSETFRYSYTSLTTPPSVFDYHLTSRKQQLMKQQEVLGSFNKNDYHTERLFALAKDGTRIPISLVYKKGLIKNGKAPLLLYGYGSYGASMDAAFGSSRLSLLNRGFVFAIAHIRGGQEMGRAWYENGKMMKKKNTFTDFIACAEFLIDNKFTSPQHLYAMGGSAGGLLMGAVINMAPKLWNGVIAQVPFVDVVNTMLDESIPLTTNEFDEWGNPKEKEAYLYMKSYSPYENIEAKEYPHLLITTGLHDSQVQYFEPAKWVARLRELKTDKNILMLKTDMAYGHGGASGRFDYLKELAFNYCFLFHLEGISQ